MTLSRRFLAAAIVASTLAAITLMTPVADATPSTFSCSLRRATVPVPHNRAMADLYDVKVVSPGDAWAVGNYSRMNIGVDQRVFPLAEHWNGRDWASVDVPRTPGAFDEPLTRLAAVSSTNIWAIGNQTRKVAIETTPGWQKEATLLQHPGHYGTGGVIDHWNGRKWIRVVLPNLHGFTWFNGVSAPGPGDVWVVGMWRPRHVVSAHILPLFLHWDGKTWTVQRPNLFPAALKTRLLDVQATSPADVYVVGAQSSRSSDSSFSASLQDGGWATSPAPSITDLSGTLGATDGEVGITEGATMYLSLGLDQLGASGWSDVPTTPLWVHTEESAADVYSTDVLQLGSSSAWLVGSQNDWDHALPGDPGYAFGPVYAEHWDGTSWDEVALPTVAPSADPWLNAVSATPDGGMVMMVGTILPPRHNKSLPLIYQGTCG